MSTLRVRLFGPLEVHHGDSSLSRFPSRKARTLFAYLALYHRRRHPRERLADLLWPDHQTAAARKRLRTELWAIRKHLARQPGVPTVLVGDTDSVGFDSGADLWIDVGEFESGLTTDDGSPGQLELATRLYRGDLLEGTYEPWCLDARENLRARYLEASRRLMSLHHRAQNWSSAIEVGRRVLRHDPLDEQTHRHLMHCFFLAGNRAAALRQYTRCADRLRVELDVEPMHETSTLYLWIKQHHGPVVPAAHGVGQEVPRVPLP